MSIMLKEYIYCYKAHKRAFLSNIHHYQHKIKLQHHTLFSAIAIDLLGPYLLKGARSNATKKFWMIPIFCILTNCLEVFIVDNMKESTVITVLLILQQRYSSIREIITDAGTNLRNLTDKGKCTLTGNDQNLFIMLQRAYNAHPLGQRSNLAEYNPKRFKFLLKKFNKGKFLERTIL